MLGISAGLSNVKSMRVSSAWDPTKLADLAHWYKYNTGITLGTGDEVATWSDNYSDNHLSVEAGKVFKNDTWSTCFLQKSFWISKLWQHPDDQKIFFATKATDVASVASWKKKCCKNVLTLNSSTAWNNGPMDF